MKVTCEHHPRARQQRDKSHGGQSFSQCFADTAARHFSKGEGHGHSHCHGHGMPYHGAQPHSVVYHSYSTCNTPHHTHDIHWPTLRGEHGTQCGGCFGADGNHLHGGKLISKIRFVERCHCHEIKLGRPVLYRNGEQPELIVKERLAAREGDMSDVEWENLRDRKTWPDDRIIPWTGVEASSPKRPASIRDIPARALESELLAAQTACRNLRTEGLTQTEIYKRIESIYIDFLGKDFRDAIAPSNDPYENMLAKAATEFQDQINRYDAGSKDPKAYIDMKGYTGMSESEMRAAVRAQYPETMTLWECMVMAYELKELGLEDIHYGNAVRDRILSSMDMEWSEDVGFVLQAMLDMPADFDTMKSMYDASTEDDYAASPSRNTRQMLENMISWVGGGDLYTRDMSRGIREMLDQLEKSGEKTFDTHGQSSTPQ